MNRKGFGSGHDLIPEFVWRDEKIHEKPSRTRQGSWFLAEIQTEHLLNTSLEHYSYTNLLIVSPFMSDIKQSYFNELIIL
jgi:hypothetical protein